MLLDKWLRAPRAKLLLQIAGVDRKPHEVRAIGSDAQVEILPGDNSRTR